MYTVCYRAKRVHVSVSADKIMWKLCFTQHKQHLAETVQVVELVST